MASRLGLQILKTERRVIVIIYSAYFHVFGPEQWPVLLSIRSCSTTFKVQSVQSTLEDYSIPVRSPSARWLKFVFDPDMLVFVQVVCVRLASLLMLLLQTSSKLG